MWRALLAAIFALAGALPADAEYAWPGVQQTGPIVTGDCLQWGPGVQDAGSACGSGGGGGGSITLPQTIAGTVHSGGIAYFSSTTVMASSALLAANALMIGGGAGVAPSTVTTGTGALTALGNDVDTTSGLVTQASTLASGAVMLGGGLGAGVRSTNTAAGFATAVAALNVAGGLITDGGAQASQAIMIGLGFGSGITSTTTGANVLTAISNAVNAASGLPNVDGSITTGHCIQWGPGVQDAGATCAGAVVLPQTISGTVNSGGVGYFSNSTTFASSGTLAANGIMLGGGSGNPPITTTTGSGIVGALAIGVDTTGGFLTAAITPTSGLLLKGGGSGFGVSPTSTGGGVLVAIGANIDSTSGLPDIDGAITTGHCLQWGPGVQDSGNTCASVQQTLSGDVTTPGGGSAVTTVAKIGGNAVSLGGALTSGEALTFTGGTTTFALGAGGQTYTFPNASDTVAVLAAAQTLTNKTIATASNSIEGSTAAGLPSSGNIGQQVTQVIAQAASGSGSWGSPGVIALSAGHWMVSAHCNLEMTGSSNTIGCAVSTTANATGTVYAQTLLTYVATASTPIIPVDTFFINVTGSTNIFLNTFVEFTTGSATVGGTVHAVRLP